ncbi:hypothetical protein [Pectobacterium brasiliense]|uniref:hypothetical protein n=1 Tax=Pectobacterium brasiliense TaxID=180957 RepID=UPI00069C486E|nr:hypothetical protein [Pectobacterium brasiliense]MCG5048023.1 hypothetical protein [Pectobacterium brasiliense]
MNLSGKNLVLMKFFSTAEYKQKFLDGQVFCNTPAYYRKSDKEGVGDRCESAIYSYYNGYEPKDGMKFEMGLGKKIGENKLSIKNLNAFIFRKSGEIDSWLNCWYALEIITTSPDATTNSLERMLREFGDNAILLTLDNWDEFLQRIKTYSEKEVEYCLVKYTDNPTKISKSCKLERYSYQKEFRFLFGECDFQCTEPYSFFVPGGFRDLFKDGFWLDLHGCTENQWPKYFK